MRPVCAAVFEAPTIILPFLDQFTTWETETNYQKINPDNNLRFYYYFTPW